MPCPANPDFKALRDYLLRVPAIQGPIGTGVTHAGFWWVKFAIDIDHPLAWNGAPKEFLSWLIECRDVEFSPARCCEWLEGRLPEPVDDREQWKAEEDQE
jgi:hypothetical protein